MLAGIVEHFGRHHLGLDTIGFLQPPPQRLGHRQRVAQASPKRLRALLQLGEMVALRLDVIAYPGLRRDQHPRVGPALALGMAVKLAQRGVEAGNAFGDRRRIVGQLDQLGAADAEVGKYPVGKNFGQLVSAGRFTAFRSEGLDVNVERFGQPQQDAGGDRALVALEVVQIGRGNAELFGHRALVESAVAAEALQAGAEQQLALSHW